MMQSPINEITPPHIPPQHELGTHPRCWASGRPTPLSVEALSGREFYVLVPREKHDSASNRIVFEKKAALFLSMTIQF